MDEATKKPSTRELYKAMKRNIAHMEQTMLELLRHPQVSANQVMNVQQQYQQMHASFIKVRGMLLQRCLINSWEA